MTTDNAPLAPSQPEAADPNSHSALAGPSLLSAQPISSGQTTAEPIKKKRGRPSKASQGDGSESTVPRKRGRSRKSGVLEAAADSLAPVASSSSLPHPAPTAGPSVAATLPVSTTQASAAPLPPTDLPGPALLHRTDTDTRASTVPASAQPDDTESPALTASNGINDVPVKKARKPLTFRTNPDGTPIPRKPYTPRLNPDGTPVSDRFKNRVQSGNLSQVSPSQSVAGPSSQPAPASHPENLGTLMGEPDALGEVDTDMIDLARHVVTAGAQASSSQSASSSGPLKTKDPLRAEKHRVAALKRWQKYREDREALGLPSRGLFPPGVRVPRSSAADSSGEPVASSSTPKEKTRALAKPLSSKEWTLYHADGYAGRAGRQITSAEQAYRDAIRSGSVRPTSASPRRVISLSGGGGPSSSSAGLNGTPTRNGPTDMARERAGSNRPRSSLPLFLSPMPTRYSVTQPSEYDDDEVIDFSGMPDDMADGDFEPQEGEEELEPEEYDEEEEEEAPGSRVTRRSASQLQSASAGKTRSRQARTSLPSRLVHTPMSTRSDRGKGGSVTRLRAGSLEDPSPRSIFTRNARLRAGAPPSLSQGSAPRLYRPRYSLPSSSQGRPRLVPEVEITRPKAASVSPIKLEPRPRPQYALTKTRVVPKPVPRAGPRFGIRAKPKPKPKQRAKPATTRRVVLKPRVVIPIGKATRARLVSSGAYDPFYDDDSDGETSVRRRGHAGLRRIALPSTSVARTSRPSDPESISERFHSREGPALSERFRSVLDPETITKRANGHECRWKGCAAQMASEWHLRRHIELRAHAAQGAFQAGVSPQV